VPYERVLDSPKKLLDFASRWAEETSSAIETSTRLGEFKKALGEGKSLREAALAAREVSTDFAMRGSSSAAQFMAISVPFLNARAQGLYRMGRVAREHPMRTGVRAMLSTTVPALTLWAAVKDDPDYQAMPDWIKDQHFVIKDEDQFYLIPMGFEYGALFGTVPIRMLEAVQTQHGKRFADAMVSMIGDTFSFNPIPQPVKPLLEGGIPVTIPEIMGGDQVTGFNKKFSGAPVVPRDLQEVAPHEQYRPWTPELLIDMAKWLKEDTGVEMSPLQVEHLVRGYFGTMGMYALTAVDMVTRDTQAAEHRWDEVPVLRSFMRQEPMRGTQFETDFYELLSDARMVAATFGKVIKEGRNPDLSERDRVLYGVREGLDAVARDVSQINKAMRLIQADKDLSAREKREQLDKYQGIKNNLFENLMRGMQGNPTFGQVYRGMGFTPVPGRAQ
jgi:hypothetical protein